MKPGILCGGRQSDWGGSGEIWCRCGLRPWMQYQAQSSVRTEFSYSDLQIHGSTVTAVITNTGSVPGAEVVQLYIAPPKDGIHRPAKELKGFVRVELEPGEGKEVTFSLDDRSFAVWADGWKVPGGSYEILLAASSQDIRLRSHDL